MTSFDKALEAAAKYHVRESDECEVMDDYSAHEDTFKAGSKWSRQFTVQEVLEFMRSDESIKKDDDFFDRNDCMMDRTLWVMEIEQHFSGDNKNENNRS